MRLMLLVALVLVTACSSSAGPVARLSPTPATPPLNADLSPSASASPTPSPSPLPPLQVPTPSPIGTTMPAEVLPPAKVMPAVALCSAPVVTTADGNFLPLFCRSGAIKVDAWRHYTTIGPHILAAGREATVQKIDGALRADSALHDTSVELLYSYTLAAAYYGWTYTPNPACVLIYSQPTC